MLVRKSRTLSSMPVIEKSQSVHVKTLMNYTLTYMNSTGYTLQGTMYDICGEREERAIKVWNWGTEKASSGLQIQWCEVLERSQTNVLMRLACKTVVLYLEEERRQHLSSGE